MNNFLILWIEKLPLLTKDFFLLPNKFGCLKTIFRRKRVKSLNQPVILSSWTSEKDKYGLKGGS